MVSEMHPHDIELFEFVEGELPEERRGEIAAHLATCSVCAEQVALASAGREALRGAGAFELPADRRAQILRSLPAQERTEPGEQRGFSPKLVFAGLVALLLVAAVIGVVVSSNGGGGMNSSAAGTGASDATASSGSGGGESEESAQAKSGFLSRGPAAEVADELQQKGFDASVERDRVVVRGATKRQVREALADRGPGDVEVVVKTP